MKRTLRALSLGLCAAASALVVSTPAQARITIDALGGEVEINGFLSSEARARVGGGEAYLSQWIQRLQLEASANYTDVGVFDTLSFVTVVRPEFDAANYYGDSLTGGHVGRNADRPSYLGSSYSYANEPVGFGGFDNFPFFRPGLDVTQQGIFGTNATGGVGKIVNQGFQNPQWLNQRFETILNRASDGGKYDGAGLSNSGLSLLSSLTDDPVDCRRCVDVDNSHLEVAMADTDSSGRLYPFRELYMDATIGDWWIRLGKQQIVWGKTDFFRLQDIINPVDFGQHFFFDSFEDIRIPQWMASIQWKMGDVGPLTDTALQLVWNFDEFQPVGLGNPTSAWAHPFGKDQSVFANYNTYFSVEPCVSAQIEQLDSVADGRAFDSSRVCGSRGPDDPRKPSGFGTAAGLAGGNDRPDWEIENTEAGLRYEFRLGEVHVAASYWYGWNDIPVFQFDNFHIQNGFLGANAGLGVQDCTVADVTGGTLSNNPIGDGPNSIVNFTGLCDNLGLGVPTGALGFPVRTVDPLEGIQGVATGGSLATMTDPVTGETALASTFAQRALDAGDATLFYRAINSTSAITGGAVSIQHKQAHTPGLSFDYFEAYTGTVFRVESSWTFDELVNNTMKPNWVDTSDVMRWSIGIDRPTWIKWLNKDRTFFLSTQLFDTWYMDHEGTKHTGFLTDEHNFIWTFFFIANYMRDRLTPLGFIVWEEASNSWVAGLNSEWKIDNHWSVKAGLHTIWGGTNNYKHDLGPYTAFIVPDRNGNIDPYVQVLGVAHEGIGALRNNDEVFFQLKYQF